MSQFTLFMKADSAVVRWLGAEQVWVTSYGRASVCQVMQQRESGDRRTGRCPSLSRLSVQPRRKKLVSFYRFTGLDTGRVRLGNRFLIPCAYSFGYSSGAKLGFH